MAPEKLRKLTLMFLSTMTVMAGAIVAPALPQIKQTFIHTPFIDLLAKSVLTLPALFIALFGPVVGYILDRYGRKKMLFYALVLYAIAGTSGLFLDDLYSILVGRAFLGIAVSGIMTTATTLIGDYYWGEERNRLMGFQASFMALGGVLFLVLSGFLADLSWRGPFGVYIFALMLVPMVAVYIFEPERKRQTAGHSSKLRITKNMALVYLLAFIAMIFFYMIPVQVPFLLHANMEIENWQVGIAISGMNLIGAFVSMQYKKIKDYLSFPTIFAISVSLMGASFLMVVVCHDFYLATLALCFGGLGTGLIFPNTTLWLVSVAPEDERGRAVGLLTTFLFLGQFVSPYMSNLLMDHKVVATSFVSAAYLLFFLAILFGVGNQVRRLLNLEKSHNKA